MNPKLPTVIAILFAVAALAEETVISKFSWTELAAAEKLKSGAVVTLPGQEDALKIENNSGAPLTATLFTIEQPKITTDFYSIVGEVRYESVKENAFLEMWSHFGDTEAYFSRTLGESGPMGKLTGSSDWRDFHLPFDAKGAKSSPRKLVINLQLPGNGTIYLRNVKLVESARSGAVGPRGDAWWTDRKAGMVAGLGGALIGCLAGFIEWLAARGKAQLFVVNALKVLIVGGVVAVVFSLAALGFKQPSGVWFALLLLGALSVLIFPFRLRRYQQHYRDLELRRISSMDVAMT